jgi:polyhydroxyalkanoate synthesis repressor PhaR
MAYVIKRSSKRKLYDTQESRSVTIEELEELIRAGREISVVDVSTGEDLTSVTLAQIILENERNHRAALPTAFLHQLIKHGEAWQDFVQKSLKSISGDPHESARNRPRPSRMDRVRMATDVALDRASSGKRPSPRTDAAMKWPRCGSSFVREERLGESGRSEQGAGGRPTSKQFTQAAAE